MLRSLNRTQNALEIILQIAAAKKPLSLSVAAERVNISLSYAEQIAAKMKRAGLIQSTKGPGGGYLLHKDRTAESISVADLVKAVQPQYQDTVTSKLPSVSVLSNILTKSVMDVLARQTIARMDAAIR